MSEITDIVDWLRQRMTMPAPADSSSGLSGGLDSAVVARLCQLAALDHGRGGHHAVQKRSAGRGRRAPRRRAHRHATSAVDLDAGYDALVEELRAAVETLADAEGNGRAETRRLPVANIRPRLRMTSLYFSPTRSITSSRHRQQERTDDRLLHEVRRRRRRRAADRPPAERARCGVAKELGVPQPIIDKPPSAGLWLGQTDEAEMGFSYADLEAVSDRRAGGVSPALALRLERLIRATEHKRALTADAGDVSVDAGRPAGLRRRRAPCHRRGRLGLGDVSSPPAGQPAPAACTLCFSTGSASLSNRLSSSSR